MRTSRYPHTLDVDAALCRRGVDLIFAPSPVEMYPPGFDSWVEVGGVTEMLEGERRPGHFRGVATVYETVQHYGPRSTYFGIKDYQQLAVIRKWRGTSTSGFVPVEIVRESDGLAILSQPLFIE